MEHRLELIAATPRLLVACDFDGVLAPIVDRPSEARALPEAMELLESLANLRQTQVAVVSGRSLEQLRRFLSVDDAPLHPQMLLVGGHGAEIAAEDARTPPPSPEMVERLDALEAALRGAVDESKGFEVERKTTGIAVHWRRAAPEAVARHLPQILETAGDPPGLRRRDGSMLVEFAAADRDKGEAVCKLRRLTGASAVIYLGDDLTDEDVFVTLGAGDLGVKIGDGPTKADTRVADLHAGIDLLRRLRDERARWIEAHPFVPIGQHAVLSDLRTAAVIAAGARVVWMCLPRIDSGSVFGELVGGPDGGHFSIEPVPADPKGARETPTHRWLGDSFILVTEWPSGITVTDYLDVSDGRAFHRAGRTDLVRVVEGRGRVRIEFAPRLDFGRTGSKLAMRPGGLSVEGAAEPMVLNAPGVSWRLEPHGRHHTAVAEVELSGEPLVLEFRGGTPSLRGHVLAEEVRRRDTQRMWSEWAAALRLPSVKPELVKRCALALRALVHGPTGAICAAATTSLPEWPGGIRNWDYRYCWPRDATMAGASLARLGSTGTAMRLLDAVLRMVDACSGPERLRPLYTVCGEGLGPEADIAGLPGYRASAPVRVGNAASEQVQLDVFGSIVNLVALLADLGVAISPEHWRLVEAMVAAVERRWQEPDHGVWEIRDDRRNHIYSRTMCWLAVDRAIRIGAHAMDVERPAWVELRDRIREDVLAHGYCKELGAFSASYEEPEADASALHVGLSGLLPPDDPRFLATIDVVQRKLRRGPTVYRYRFDDGLPGREGGFYVCTAWLVQALLLAGRRSEAEELFEQMTALAGPLGLFSEQYDPIEGCALGNYPQGYSAVGVIDCAVALSQHGT